MATIASLEKAIASCKEEQAKLHGWIEHHRALLAALTSRPETPPDGSESLRPAETDTSLGDTDDLKLLEQALEKALRVRTGGAVSKNGGGGKKNGGPGKEPAASSGVTSKGFKKPPAKGTQTGVRFGGVAQKSVASKPSRSTSTTSRHCPGVPPGTREQQPVAESDICYRQPSVTSAAEAPSTDVSAARQQTGISADQAARWRHLKNKQNRLWDKAAAAQRKVVPGRSRFVERMSSMFPQDWPCGVSDPITVTHQNLPGRHPPRGDADPEWDRWRPEGGGPHPGDGGASLPPTVVYRSRSEFKDLERLRVKVALLQQEMNLQQALSDAISPQLASIVVPGCSDPSVLRDVYSLLGEGGRRFPAIVLDSD